MTKLDRIDDVRSRVCGIGVDAILYATDAVEIDRTSLASLAALDFLRDALDVLSQVGFLSRDSGVARAVLTPDFHRGAHLPVGVALDLRGAVVPASIGNDIGCGMALAVLEGVQADEITGHWAALAADLRHAFFQGGRAISAQAASRHAVLSTGLSALDPQMLEGVWEEVPNDIGDRLARAVHDPFGPVQPGTPFREWIAPGGREGPQRDQFLGTIGGGNHFVELQQIGEVVDGQTAWDWQLAPGSVAVMVHSGSVGLGRAVANVHEARLRARYPKGVRRPRNWLLPLPVEGENADLGLGYLGDMAAAARFAALNRVILSLMVRRVLSKALGRPLGWRLVHDLPHNAVWHQPDGAVLHRKGACPALSGAPVIVPGSMGTESALLKGCGSDACLSSAPHGAGRALRRNAARSVCADTPVRVVTPVDLTGARADLRKDAARRLAEEAPRAYKPIGPVIDTMVRGAMATPVARLLPLATIKG